MAEATPAELVRFLLNDPKVGVTVFTDKEIDGYLALEGGNVKRAAAQAIDTIADNEALASKVLRTQDVQTDGAKVADALRKRAVELRRQADVEDADTGDYFDVVDLISETCYPELTEHTPLSPWWP